MPGKWVAFVKGDEVSPKMLFILGETGASPEPLTNAG